MSSPPPMQTYTPAPPLQPCARAHLRLQKKRPAKEEEEPRAPGERMRRQRKELTGRVRDFRKGSAGRRSFNFRPSNEQLIHCGNMSAPPPSSMGQIHEGQRDTLAPRPSIVQPGTVRISQNLPDLQAGLPWPQQQPFTHPGMPGWHQTGGAPIPFAFGQAQVGMRPVAPTMVPTAAPVWPVNPNMAATFGQMGVRAVDSSMDANIPTWSTSHAALGQGQSVVPGTTIGQTLPGIAGMTTAFTNAQDCLVGATATTKVGEEPSLPTTGEGMAAAPTATPAAKVHSAEREKQPDHDTDPIGKAALKESVDKIARDSVKIARDSGEAISFLGKEVRRLRVLQMCDEKYEPVIAAAEDKDDATVGSYGGDVAEVRKRYEQPERQWRNETENRQITFVRPIAGKECTIHAGVVAKANAFLNGKLMNKVHRTISASLINAAEVAGICNSPDELIVDSESAYRLLKKLREHEGEVKRLRQRATVPGFLAVWYYLLEEETAYYHAWQRFVAGISFLNGVAENVAPYFPSAPGQQDLPWKWENVHLENARVQYHRVVEEIQAGRTESQWVREFESVRGVFSFGGPEQAHISVEANPQQRIRHWRKIPEIRAPSKLRPRTEESFEPKYGAEGKIPETPTNPETLQLRPEGHGADPPTTPATDPKAWPEPGVQPTENPQETQPQDEKEPEGSQDAEKFEPEVTPQAAPIAPETKVV